MVLDLSFVQTFANISQVEYGHMRDLQHHGTDLFLEYLCGLFHTKMK